MMIDALKVAFALAAMTSLVVGCQPANGPAPATSAKGGDHAHGEHGHGEHGSAPHGGHLIELGEEEFHAELVDDDKAGTVTVYLLGSDAKSPVDGDEDEVVLNLVVEGKPSQFKLSKTGDKRNQFGAKNADLMKALDSQGKTAGRLNVKIGGKSYVGKLEHSHDDHKD